MIRSFSKLKAGDGTKVMTYNVLAQALVRREQYPTSGKFLRWGNRSKVFSRELDTYDADILLLQEVDNDHRKFWRDLLEPRGYHCIFHQQPSKKHGLAICFKTAKFSMQGTEHHLDIDSVKINGIPRQCETKNVALLVRIVAKESTKTLLVGTAHLYWHPDASYERSRQLLCILTEIEKLKGASDIAIFGGDCNTEYFDPPYLLATDQPLDAQATEIMSKSVAAVSFDKMGAVQIENGVATTLALDPSQASANPSLLLKAEAADDAQARLQRAFQSHNLVASSSYALYSSTGREASRCGEPLYTNWTEVFKGTLDYIFTVHERDTAPLEVLGLLDVPTCEEIGSGGLPKATGGPSDHICIMAELDIT